MTGTRHVPRRRLLAVVLAVALVSFLAPAAVAQPTSGQVRGELDRARDRLDELDEQRGLALERFNEAQVELDDVVARLTATQTELEELRADSELLGLIVEEHVRTLHKLGPTLELSSIAFAGDPVEAGVKSATLRRILQGRQTDLEALHATRIALAATEIRLAEERADAEQRTVDLESRRHELEASFASTEREVAQLRALLQDRLQAEEEARRREEERLRQLALQRQRERETAQRAQQQQRTSTPRASSGASTRSTSTAPRPAPAARASADVAVQTALAQLGKPYRWGGNGPGSYDCSGLTSYAWRAAGVSLPRTSRAQYGATRRISRSELQPGDLVFYHSPISHVAMYIGNGQVVEAPNSGNSVRIRSDGLTRRGIVGYGRP